MTTISYSAEHPDIEFLHEIGSHMAAAGSLDDVLERIVNFASTVVRCDSCFVYVLEEDELVLRASRNPHPEVLGRLRLHVGQGITGWVAEHREPAAVARNAYQDPRFKALSELQEDKYEAFLSVPVLCRDRLVGVINLQHRKPHAHSRREIQLMSTIGFLVGAEIELARLESENTQLSERLETRKLVERAKGILQQEMQISEEEAYLLLQRQSRQARKSMKDIAEVVVTSREVRARGNAR
jgi:signal transduction protein with GAF and PtsI domain